MKPTTWEPCPLTNEGPFVNVHFLPLLLIRTQAGPQADLGAVVAVGTEHHGAVLPVKGEVGDLDGVGSHQSCQRAVRGWGRWGRSLGRSQGSRVHRCIGRLLGEAVGYGSEVTEKHCKSATVSGEDETTQNQEDGSDGRVMPDNGGGTGGASESVSRERQGSQRRPGHLDAAAAAIQARRLPAHGTIRGHHDV